MDQTVGINKHISGKRGNYEKGLETRARLLDSAVSMFASRGYNGSSVAELAGEGGCSKNQLFHHFGSKEDLAIETVLAAYGLWRADVATATAVFANPAVRIDRIVRQVRNLEAGGWPAIRLLALLTLTSDSLPPRLNSAVSAMVAEITGFIEGVCSHACRVSPDARIPAQVLARTVACLIFGWGTLGPAQNPADAVTPGALLGLTENN